MSASTLSPADWTNAGPVKAGVDGLMGLTDPGGVSQRFYRIIVDS